MSCDELFFGSTPCHSVPIVHPKIILENMRSKCYRNSSCNSGRKGNPNWKWGVLFFFSQSYHSTQDPVAPHGGASRQLPHGVQRVHVAACHTPGLDPVPPCAGDHSRACQSRATVCGTHARLRCLTAIPSFQWPRLDGSKFQLTLFRFTNLYTFHFFIYSFYYSEVTQLHKFGWNLPICLAMNSDGKKNKRSVSFECYIFLWTSDIVCS